MSLFLGPLIGVGFGAIIGSFLATVASRWPRSQSVITGRSRCENCGRTLTALDLVPLASWLRTRGKCRVCGARIDWVHPLIELGCAVIGGYCAWAFDPLAAVLLALGGWLLLTLAVLDARHMWLPDALTLPLATLGLTLGDWILPAPFWDRAIGAAVGGGFLALLGSFYKRVRGQDGLGLGDAKLLGAIGAWMGWQALPFVLLIASAAAIVWVLALRLTGRSVDGATRIPLGTFLCMAVVPAWATLTILFA